MRRLLPTARSFLIHSGQIAGFSAVALMAMAFAPAPAAEGPIPYLSVAAPEAPPVTAIAEPAGPITRKISFIEPVKGYSINSGFGIRRLNGRTRPHEGVDIAAPMGTGVHSAAEGEVLRTGYDARGYGRFIEIRHPNGMTTLYGHLSRVDVATGDRIEGDERIGLVGSTGRSTGPHLHFEVRRGDRQIDPTRVMGEEFSVILSPASV
jgi:murein DD-endopeptidase MepM/ murein hydrolase activator NlpD